MQRARSLEPRSGKRTPSSLALASALLPLPRLNLAHTHTHTHTPAPPPPTHPTHPPPQSLLSGADALKLAFVSRVAKADGESHSVVGVVSYPPAAFASQLGLSAANMWGVLRWFVELVRKHAVNLRSVADVPEDEYVAKFVLLRDPNTPKLLFYAVPPNAFDAEGGDGGSEDGDNA